MISSNHYDVQLLTQLRNKIYIISLTLLMVIPTCLVTIQDAVSSQDSFDLLSIWFLLMCVCGISLLSRRTSFTVSTYALFIGLLMVFALAAQTSPPEFLLAIIPVFLPIAALLFGRRNSFFLLLISLFIVLQSPAAQLPQVDLAPYLFIIFISFLTSIITVEGFYELLTVMQDYQLYALEQMQEARESRAILAKRTQNLATSSQNLTYANRQLRIAKHQIEEAHRLKAQFAANVSHELRTPINLVVGFAETIMRFPKVYGRPLPTEYLSDIRTIYRNGKHLQNLINDVLDISQIESGHMALVKDRLSISAVIFDAANMLRNQINNKGLDLQIDLPDTLPMMWLDRVRIRQIFINLLGNAIRFTDSGCIAVKAFEDGNHIMICVSDTGIGIPPDEVENIFEEFYQANHINQRGEGSGLGLTLSRRFVQMHHGEIWAESTGIDEQGSQFWIRLPLEMQSPLATSGDMRALSTEKNNILIMNDDPRVIEFFERHLSTRQVIGTKTLAAAVDMLDKSPTALIIDREDYHRHRETDLLHQLESKLTIITCSMPSGRRYMKSLGVADYLIKPVSADALAESVQHLSPTPKHILIVDDDKEIVRLFARLLKAIIPDCQLTMAYGGQEALALLDSIHPDLVLLDILMPDIDGLSVLDIIKHTPDLADIPVIIASAKGASEAISPATDGYISVRQAVGLQPLALVQCIDQLVEILNPLV